MLNGKKTYLAALGIAIVTGAVHLGYLDGETAKTLLSLLGAGGLAALRAGVEKKS